jgi:hypothetical protein
MCILYNQQDATYTMFFIIIISALHVSGSFSAQHKELIKLYMQLSAEQFEPNHTSGRRQESMTIPMATHTVLYAPDDGRKNRPKHVER